MHLIRALQGARDDRGSALAGVIGLMLVIALVSVGVLSTTLASVRVSTSARADVQSSAAADAGIDVAFASIYAGGYLCAFQPASVSSQPQYAATVVYRDATGGVVPCDKSNTTKKLDVRTATITSVGTSAGAPIGTSRGATQTVLAQVDITQTTTTTGGTPNPLSKLLYSSAPLTLGGAIFAESTPGAKDADTYSGGAAICKTGSSVGGTVTALGNVSLTDQCDFAGSLWTTGSVTAGAGSSVGGDIYSAGKDPVTLGSGVVVGGSVLANGDVALTDAASRGCAGGVLAKVCGSVVATNGALTLSSGAAIAASGYAKKSITLQNAVGQMIGGNAAVTGGDLSVMSSAGAAGIIGGYARIQGKVVGQSNAAFVTGAASSCQYGASTPLTKCAAGVDEFPALTPAQTFPSAVGYPTTKEVSPPAAETMPAIGVSSSDLSRWTSAGWEVVTVKGCSAGKAYIDGMTDVANGSKKTLLNVTDCIGQLVWSNAQFTVYNDFAVVNAGGFSFTKGTNGIRSSSSVKREVSLIVPTGATGTISTDNTTFTNVHTLLYTPGAVTMQNWIYGFSGQIYAGSITSPVTRSTLMMHQMNVPGAGAPAQPPVTTTTYSAAITSRLDVAGS